jgi:hypothetical protein
MNSYALAPDESSYRELKNVLTNILRDVAPGEVSAFEKTGALIPGVASVDNESKSEERRVRTRGIPGVMEAGLVSLHLVAGTLALVEMYRKRRERLEQRELENSIRQEWQKALIQAGMSAELANQIPVKFSPDMIRFITTQRFRTPDERESTH